MDRERLSRQRDFILEIDKEKLIQRQTHLSMQGRRENDAEHAWHMAIMAYLLKEYANEDIDISRVMIMCLIHDIVEIDAGDTYAYDAEGLKTQKEREKRAKERIFALLPEDQKAELQSLFEEFEAYETPEQNMASVRQMLDAYDGNLCTGPKIDFLVLPEIFTCPYDNKCFHEFAESDGGTVYRFPEPANELYDHI